MAEVQVCTSRYAKDCSEPSTSVVDSLNGPAREISMELVPTYIDAGVFLNVSCD